MQNNLIHRCKELMQCHFENVVLGLLSRGFNTKRKNQTEHTVQEVFRGSNF